MRRALPWVFGLSLTFVLLITAVLIPALSYRAYQRETRKYKTYEAIGVDAFYIDRVLAELILYMEHDWPRETPMYNPGYPTWNGAEPFYTERAVEHMRDVRGIVQAAIKARYALAVLALMALAAAVGLYGRDAGLYRLGTAYLISAAAVLGVGVVVAIAGYVNFDKAFVTFHHIFFSNDLWQLDWDDRLLMMMPTGFFVDMAVRIGFYAVGLLGGAAALAGFARFMCKED